MEADFAGGNISSNGGALLLAAADRRLGPLSGLARRLNDERQAGKVGRKLLPLLRQRVTMPNEHFPRKQIRIRPVWNNQVVPYRTAADNPPPAE